jgi:diadenosine tetraphosphate (Ap4A) HIT family hydrolase
MNETILRFGYPATLIREYEHWVVLLRPAQPTLGSLILAAKGEETRFPMLAPEAFAGLRGAVHDIENALGAAVPHDKINYLMLMMVDPHVHFHVIPRYEGKREACGVSVRDTGWPKVPALAEAVTLEPGQVEALTAYLKSSWPIRRCPPYDVGNIGTPSP